MLFALCPLQFMIDANFNADKAVVRLEIRCSFIIDHRIDGQQLITEINPDPQQIIKAETYFLTGSDLTPDIIPARLERWGKKPFALPGHKAEAVSVQRVSLVFALIKCALDAESQTGKTEVAFQLEVENRARGQIVEADQRLVHSRFDTGSYGEYYAQQHII
jgi:hypothetical protein